MKEYQLTNGSEVNLCVPNSMRKVEKIVPTLKLSGTKKLSYQNHEKEIILYLLNLQTNTPKLTEGSERSLCTSFNACGVGQMVSGRRDRSPSTHRGIGSLPCLYFVIPWKEGNYAEKEGRGNGGIKKEWRALVGEGLERRGIRGRGGDNREVKRGERKCVGYGHVQLSVRLLSVIWAKRT